MERSDLSPKHQTDARTSCFMKSMNHPYITLFCSGCGHKLVVPVYCKNRFCPVCSRRRIKIVRHRIKALLDRVPAIPGRRIGMLTLTMKSMTDPRKMSDEIVAAFRRLRQSKFFINRVSGGVYVLEVKQNSQGWHVHIHAIIQADYIPRSWLVKRWKKITGSWNVDIRLKDKGAALSYVTKYITVVEKGTDQKAAAAALRDKRLFQCFGTFHGYLKPYAPPKFRCPDCDKTDWFTDAELGSFRHSRDVSPYSLPP
jgi:hypothetical protein